MGWVAATTTMRTLIAYDGSGSTGGVAFYHDKTQEIVGRYPDAEILYWDSSYRQITREELAEINRHRGGGGGTNSAAIAQGVCDSDFHGHLIIITDGQVDTASIDRCSRLLGTTWNFASVVAHLIDTGGTVNMSVTCPFTRVSPHEVFCYREAAYEPVRVAAVSKEDLRALAEIDTIACVADYEARTDLIERLVIARTMGTTGDLRLRDSVLAMKKRIVAAEARVAGESDSVAALRRALDGGSDSSDAIAAAQAIYDEYYGEERGWSARITRLVSMCEGALRGAFDLSGIQAAVRGDRVRRAETVAEADLPAAASETGSDSFVCPITLDTESDVILLVASGEPILSGLDVGTVNDILDCPLNLFRYSAVVDALVGRLDHPVSLTAYRAAGEPFATSPLTRRPLLAGGICVGNSEAHCRATAWTLAQLTTGGKLVGNADLWFACIWLLVARDGRLAYLCESLLPILTAHGRWRLREHTTFIGLTGLPEFPTTRVPVGVAIWYIFASSVFTGGTPKHELIRVHMSHLEELRELLVGLTDYRLPAGMEKHVVRVRGMLAMLGAVKRDRRRLPEILRGLCQGSLDIGEIRTEVAGRERVPAVILLDGPPSAERIAAVRGMLPAVLQALTDDELVGIGGLVGPDKAAGDIALPFNWVAPVRTVVGTVRWTAYGLETPPKNLLRICPRTCRPYYRVAEGRTWVEEAEALYGAPRSSLISVERRFGDFVCRYGFYPTAAEMLVYLANRYGSGCATLPRAITQFVDEVLEEYGPIMAELPAAEMARRFAESCPLERRMETESA